MCVFYIYYYNSSVGSFNYIYKKIFDNNNNNNIIFLPIYILFDDQLMNEKEKKIIKKRRSVMNEKNTAGEIQCKTHYRYANPQQGKISFFHRRRKLHIINLMISALSYQASFPTLFLLQEMLWLALTLTNHGS